MQTSIDSPAVLTGAALLLQQEYSFAGTRSSLELLFQRLDLPDQLLGAHVLVKPNCTGAYAPDLGRTTHPVVTAALISLLKDLRCRVIVGESPSVGVSSSEAFERTGIQAVVKEMGVPLLDFREAPRREIPVPDGVKFSSLDIPEALLEVDYLISVPKLKTNFVTTISCAIKNLKGVLADEQKRDFHRRGLADSVVDLYSALRTRLRLLAVVDGIVGSELYEPKTTGILLAASDLLAGDARAAIVMGIDPHTVAHLNLAQKRGLGSLETTPDEALFAVFPRFRSTLPGLHALQEKFGVELIDGRPCSSCLGALYHCLRKVSESAPNLLSGARISIGSDLSNSSIQPSIEFGCCATQGCRDSSLSALGCPPRSDVFIQALENFKNYAKQR